jgi:hypothetical protein
VKRLLQGLAVLQVLLVVALAWRIFHVWSTPLPEAGDIPELPAVASLPPPKPVPKISEAVTQSVVEHDLFDEERGQGAQDIEVDPNALPEVPVPPPSTVKLMGVMVLGGEPVGILLDTSVKPEQQSVRKGEMFGEYEVGDITTQGLLLLGTGGQQFQIPLKVEAAAGGAVVAGAAAPGGPPPPPRTPGTRPTPPPKPVSARPNAAAKAEPAAEADGKAMSARERAQAIAQRNAELRKQNQQKNPGNEEAEAENAEPNPVQARLEALRQLREAAKSR